MQRALRHPAALAFAAALVAPAAVESQTSGPLNALGYGLIGAATGALATIGSSCDDGSMCVPAGSGAATAGGLILGLVVGGAISRTANRAVREGRSLTGGKRVAVTLGTVLGGYVLGIVAGTVLTRGDDDDAGLIGGLVGASYGAYHVASHWGQFGGQVAETVSLDVTPLAMVHGRPGLGVSVRF